MHRDGVGGSKVKGMRKAVIGILLLACSTTASYPEGFFGEGTGDGEFDSPGSVAVAPDGSVYVSDYLNNRIQKFTPEGVFVSKWGTEGTSDGEFDGPTFVAEASDGSVYVADSGNYRIQKFSPRPYR